MNKKFLITISILLLVLFATILIDSINHTRSDEPVDSDVIIMLGGGDQGRVQEAANLYDAGYADTVIMTPVGDRYSTDEQVSIVRHYGIAEEDVLIDDESTTTYTNAVQSMELMEAHGFDSALVVTSDYHVKRAAFIFDRLNDGSMTFNYIAATNLAGERWYERENAHVHWFNEFVSMWGYRMGLYRFVG